MYEKIQKQALYQNQYIAFWINGQYINLIIQ